MASIQRIAVVGAGLIGGERINAIARLAEQGRPIRLAGVFDPARKQSTFGSLDELFQSRPDWVFIATPHDAAVSITETALKQGCRVLAEKPLGRNSAEAARVTAAAGADQLFVGFDYRFLDGVTQACHDIRSGALGRLIAINMILGHGHSPEMRDSWKLQPDQAGGGCLIDPGVHLLDLAYLFAGPDIQPIGGRASSGFWNTGIEEECHLILCGGGVTLNLQTSIVRWRSTFGIEIHGETGYALIEGRSRSFGPQRYTRGRRWAWRDGPSQRDSEQVVLESANQDVFLKETQAVLFPDPAAPIQPCSGAESLRNMKLLDACRLKMGIAP